MLRQSMFLPFNIYSYIRYYLFTIEQHKFVSFSAFINCSTPPHPTPPQKKVGKRKIWRAISLALSLKMSSGITAAVYVGEMGENWERK